MTSFGTEVHSIILLSGMLKMAHLPKYHGSMSPMANCSDSINSSGFYRILFFFPRLSGSLGRKAYNSYCCLSNYFTITEICPWPSRQIPELNKDTRGLAQSSELITVPLFQTGDNVYLLYLIGNMRSNGDWLQTTFFWSNTSLYLGP